MARKQPKPIQQLTPAQFEELFPDEDACAAYLIVRRWPEGVRCPRCGSDHVYGLKTMAYKWECMDCGEGISYRFSHIAGTIFENTNKPLRDWFKVAHLMLVSKKGMSALQIMRYMGFGSYKTAWLMCHKIRAALIEYDADKLGGIVEVDETFIGGKMSNRHKDKRGGKRGGGGWKAQGKSAVVGAVKRKGNVVARVVENVNADTLTAFVKETVSEKVSLLCTDEWKGYNRLRKDFPQHEQVLHREEQYVIGAVHTQTIEGFWSLIKRGCVGTFHKVSKKYLHLYVAEF